MEFFAISGLLNGLAAIGLAAFVYFRSPNDPRHWTFGLFGIATAIWSFGYFAWQISDSEVFALFYLRVLMAGAIFIPICFLHHVLSLLHKEDSWKTFLKWHYVIGAIFLVLDTSPIFVKTVQSISIFPYWGVPGVAFHFCLVWWIAIVIVATSLLIQEYFNQNGLPRRQILYLLIGSVIGWGGGGSNYALWYGIELLPYGTVGCGIYLAIVAYSLLRFQWLDFSMYVEKGMSYFALLLLVSQPIYPLLLFAQKSVFGAINLKFSVVQLVVHLLTVAGAYQLKVGSRGTVGRIFLKGREFRSRAVYGLTAKSSQLQNVSELGQAILEILQKGAGATKAALFVMNHEEHRYQAIANFGFSHDATIIRKGWEVSDDLPQMLLLNQERIASKDVLKAQSICGEKEVTQEADDYGLDWYYPLLEDGRLLGFLAVGASSGRFTNGVGGEVFWNAIIQESILVLENAIMREEIRRFQGMLCQMDRLRSVETMTSGLTQELDNPVRSIKAFVQLAQLRRHDSEFMEELHRVVGKDLASIEELVREIREYVKPLSTSLTKPVHIHDVIDSCLLFIASNPAHHNIMIQKTFSAHATVVLAERQAIMQAIFNALLFLLKDVPSAEKIIEITTKTDRHLMGPERVQVILQWKSSVTPTDTKLVSLESLELENDLSKVDGSSIEQGVMLAHQIIQHHAGDLQLLTNQGSIVGFHFQLPVHLSEDLVSSLDSLSASPLSVN